MHRYSGPCACFGCFTVKFFVYLFMLVTLDALFHTVKSEGHLKLLSYVAKNQSQNRFHQVLLIMLLLKFVQYLHFIKRGEIEDTLSK